MSKFSVHNTDCYEFMKTMPDNSVDLILTDPPYNISKYSTGNIYLPGREALNNDIAEWDEEELKPKDLVYDFKRILKSNGNIFAFTSYNLVGKWHEAFDKEFDTFQFFIWHKTNPAPKIFKNGFLNSCEMIICMWNKGHKWNFSNQRDMHNFFESPICMAPERLKNPKHPAQKPVRLLKHIINIASNEGDIVFDPFMGTGSTGVAALQLERRFGGCEIDNIYFKAAQQRLTNIINNHKGELIMSSYSEREIIPIVLDIIKKNPGIRTSGLIDKARAEMNPSEEDLTILNDRTDDKFSQKVRNIKSHKSIIDLVETTDEKNCQWFLKK